MTAATITATVEIVRITPALLLDLDDIPRGAEWAVIMTAQHAIMPGRVATSISVLRTDADVVNVTATAAALATMYHARYIEPEATCEYCGRPTTGRYCPARPGRDCENLDAGREWRTMLPQHAGLVDEITDIVDTARALGFLPGREAA